MPVKVTENTTTSSSRTEEYVEKTHGEKVSDGMKEYWKEKKISRETSRDRQVTKKSREIEAGE